jgi:hypothetical protein
MHTLSMSFSCTPRKIRCIYLPSFNRLDSIYSPISVSCVRLSWYILLIYEIDTEPELGDDDQPSMYHGKRRVAAWSRTAIYPQSDCSTIINYRLLENILLVEQNLFIYGHHIIHERLNVLVFASQKHTQLT